MLKGIGNEFIQAGDGLGDLVLALEVVRKFNILRPRSSRPENSVLLDVLEIISDDIRLLKKQPHTVRKTNVRASGL